MSVKFLALPLAAGLLALCGCDYEDWGAAERRSKDFHFSYPLKSAGKVTVESFNGSIEVSGWDQDTVDLSGTKYAPSDELLEALKIDVQNSPDSVYIRAVRPSSHRGNMGAKMVIKVPRKAQVDRVVSSNGAVRLLDLEGPARVKTSNGMVRAQHLKGSFDGQTSNGAVELQDVEGTVSVHTSNGRVRAEGIRGGFEATTSNGGINVVLAKTEPGKTVRLETSNGGVELTLPDSLQNDVRVSTNNAGITVRLPGTVNARLSARTSNSGISSDFEVRTQGENSKHRLDGTIGSGGPMIDLNTSNGSIKLVRM